MQIGTYKNQRVKVYYDGSSFIVEFDNGSSFTTTDISEIVFD